MFSAKDFSDSRIRKVIFHYHFFKNSGTSLDFVLQNSFLGKWCCREFFGDRRSMEEEAVAWINSANEMICFSSHTYVGKPPSNNGLLCIPVFFIRHPLDRLVSVYEFEKKQNVPGYGPEMAKRMDLVNYVLERNRIDNQLTNFHTARLTEIFGINRDLGEISRCLASLPFVGVVDLFDKSIRSLAKVLNACGFPSLVQKPVFENVNRDVFASLDSRLNELREAVGCEFYRYLEEANTFDLAIYEIARARLLSTE